jgi:diguanylate cyclase (GGDEF)-like protein
MAKNTQDSGDDDRHFQYLFEYAPISLWEEDFSEVKKTLDEIRLQGVVDLGSYLKQNPELAKNWIGKIRVVDVNRKTLEQFGANTKEELLNHLDKLFRDEMQGIFLKELMYIWDGKREFECEGVNYTLSSEQLEINMRWAVLPGFDQTLEKVLVTIEDFTERNQVRRELEKSEQHFRVLFENSPVSLWEEDFSGAKRYLDQLREQGVSNLKDYLLENPIAVDECMAKIRVLDINRKTLELYGARSKSELLNNIEKIFRDEMRGVFREELLEIWDGKVEFEREGVNYSLHGEPVDIDLRWSALPGFEKTMERTLVSITNITARKRAEAYLKYLGTHDVMTGLYNRTYFEEERARQEKGRRFPVSIAIADVDGLKPINDQFGHAVGDELLRRVGEVLRAGFRAEDMVARIGGDEFAVIMPDTNTEVAVQAIERIRKLLVFNNSYYQGPELSISLGMATGDAGCFLEDVQKLADDRMYQEKREKHREKRV